jgi:hypothetical protein
VHLKPHLHQVLNHLLNLPFICHVLHRNNHMKISFVIPSKARNLFSRPPPLLPS